MTEQLQLQPQQNTFPLNGQKVDVIYNTQKTLFKADTNSYDNWESISSQTNPLLTDNAPYIFEFPSNRKHISNMRFYTEITITAAGVGAVGTEYIILSPLGLCSNLGDIKFWISATQIGSTYTGTFLDMYWNNVLTTEQKKLFGKLNGNITTSNATGKYDDTFANYGSISGSPITAGTYVYRLEVPILCPGNTPPLYKTNCRAFPLYKLNNQNKKYRMEINFNPTKLFTLTATAGNTLTITDMKVSMRYTYTASDKFNNAEKMIMYEEIKGMVIPKLSINTSTYTNCPIEPIKAPSECQRLIIKFQDTNPTTGAIANPEQSVNVQKIQLFANTDKLFDILSDFDYYSRYVDRKGIEPYVYIGDEDNYISTGGVISTGLKKYPIYLLPFAKHSEYKTMYDYYSSGVILNNLNSLYLSLMQIDSTVSTCVTVTAVAVYKHQLIIEDDGEPKILSNY